MKGLLIGLIVGLGLGAVGTAQAAPDKPNQEFYKSPNCRGNGDGGYRACRINIEGPYDKLSMNVYVDDEFEFGLVWQPMDESYKVVKR